MLGDEPRHLERLGSESLNTLLPKGLPNIILGNAKTITWDPLWRICFKLNSAGDTLHPVVTQKLTSESYWNTIHNVGQVGFPLVIRALCGKVFSEGASRKSHDCYERGRLRNKHSSNNF